MERLKINKAIEFTYVSAVTSSKIAIILLYFKLFARHRRWLRYYCYVIAAIIILVFLYGIISAGVGCSPFAYNWDKTIPGGKCFDILTSYRWVSFPQIVTDVALMAVSFPAIYKIQVPASTKVGLFATFAIGSMYVLSVH